MKDDFLPQLSPDRATTGYLWLIPIAAAISLVVYIGASALVFRTGFPLDDAWIHQTYARNLALHREWAFLLGEPSAGSTSPLWTILLTPGYWLGLAPYFWTFLLGWLALTGVGLAGIRIFRALHLNDLLVFLGVGLLLVFDWHLVWAAASGMETITFSLIILLVFASLYTEPRNWTIIGLLVGVSIWLRPDGVTLVGPALVIALFVERSWKTRSFALLKFAGTLLIIAGPYLLFNLALSGSLWPNTFFAKQAEYAVLRESPLAIRFIRQVGLILIGSGALLLPGFVISLIRASQRKDVAHLASTTWVIGFLLLYAIRLPVVYQHGRYVIPVIPMYLLLSLAGMADWVSRNEPMMWKRVISRVWMISAALIQLAFWGIGARAYGYDVAIIESEMVSAARWVAANTEPKALIAAHDIGALGFFGDRQLLDLAGLVSPEVIPFIREEGRIAAYLNEKGVDYLMTFPGWYPDLVPGLTPVFDSNGRYSDLQGGENMQIYLWR
jgi:hypothetical protein